MGDFNNIFNNGFHLGRFWCSFIIHDAFCGIDMGLGVQTDDDARYFALTIQVGYGLVVIGFDLDET
jgi:hypothetical protein